MMARRLIALLMLVTVAGSSVESVVGQLRDGAIHHESISDAAAHASVSHGEHGHEDESSHGPDHQHGTPTDHCTHQHGTPLRAPRVVLSLILRPISYSFVEPFVWSDRFSEPSFRPPQA